METRKLQEVGGGSFTVAIPKEWVQSRELEPGATMHLRSHLDDSIIVREAPRDGDILSPVELELADQTDQAIDRVVRRANESGIETITLRSNGGIRETHRRSIRSAVRTIAGATIQSEESESIKIRFALDPSQVSIRQSLEQLRFVALSLHRQATQALIDGDEECLDRVGEHATEARRIRDMLARHCNRSLVSFHEIDQVGWNRPALFDAAAAGDHLYNVATSGHRIAELAGPKSLADPTATAVRSGAEETREAVDDALGTFLDHKPANNATNIIEESNALVEDLRDIDKDTVDDSESHLDSRKQAVDLARALDALEDGVDAARSIAEIGLGSSLRPLKE